MYVIRRAWNILEDQRMETAMYTMSPALGKYFTSIVLDVVMNLSSLGSNWPWIAGRTYLPATLRQAVRDSAEEMDFYGVIPRINEAIMGYRKSTDAREMLLHVIDFAECLKLWGKGGRNTDEHSYSSGMYYDEDDRETDMPSAMPDAIPKPGEHKMEQPSKPVERKPEAVSEEHPTKSTEASQGVSGPRESPEAEAPDVTEQRKLEEQARKASEEKLKEEFKEEIDKNINDGSSEEVDEFISSVNEILSRNILPDQTISPMNNEEINQSIEVANSMMNVLDQLVVQVDPTWQLFKEDGVIDPTLFQLREPGDTNFWSGLDGDGANGHDVAISVLLDSSGSMSAQMGKVSIAAMGIRKACDELGIPCTITTFNDSVYMMADANNKVDFIRVGATGGTSIIDALLDLDNQKCDKTYHLVIILTDGEWSDVSDVRLWATPQRSIVIAGFGSLISGPISSKNADKWLVLDDVTDLYKVVTESLVNHLV
jgi:hypothetical protein